MEVHSGPMIGWRKGRCAGETWNERRVGKRYEMWHSFAPRLTLRWLFKMIGPVDSVHGASLAGLGWMWMRLVMMMVVVEG